MATIYDGNGNELAAGLQGSDTCDEAVNLAKKLANERGETVTLEDDDGEWEIEPDDGYADADIQALSDEAAAAGDEAQVALCAAALDGDTDARRECARVIAEAAAQADVE